MSTQESSAVVADSTVVAAEAIVQALQPTAPAVPVEPAKTKEQLAADKAVALAQAVEAEKALVASLSGMLDSIGKVSKHREIGRAADTVEIGRMGHEYLVGCIGDTAGTVRRRRRGAAVDRLKITVATYTLDPVDINRDIRSYHVARLFGLEQALAMPVSVLKVFGSLVERNEETEAWTVRAEIADKAACLWGKAFADKTSIRDLNDEVGALLDTTTTGSSIGTASVTPATPTVRKSGKAGKKSGPVVPEAPAECKAPNFTGNVVLAARKAFAESTDGAEKSLRAFGNIIDKTELTALIGGIAQSVKADKERQAIWGTLVSVVRAETELLQKSGALIVPGAQRKAG